MSSQEDDGDNPDQDTDLAFYTSLILKDNQSGNILDNESQIPILADKLSDIEVTLAKLLPNEEDQNNEEDKTD